MSISSVNCTPIKPQVSFGKTDDIQDAQRVLNLSRQLNDEFAPATAEKKNPFQIALSVGGAMLTTFVLGKVGMSRLLTAFPSVPGKIASSNLVGQLKKCAGKVGEKATDFVNGEKGAKIAKSVVDKAMKLTLNAKNYIADSVAKNGAEKVLKNAAGLATMAVAVPQIITADGNNDGCADIAQKGINAYSSAVRKADLLGDLINAVS